MSLVVEATGRVKAVATAAVGMEAEVLGAVVMVVGLGEGLVEEMEATPAMVVVRVAGVRAAVMVAAATVAAMGVAVRVAAQVVAG